MSKTWEEKKVGLGGAIVAAAVTLVLGVVVGLNWNSLMGGFLPYLGFSKAASNDWSALDEVYNKLSLNFNGDLDKSVLLEGAKKGLVAAAGDVYTEYMGAEEAKDYQAALHGKIGAGIGVEMALRDGVVRILRTLPDNPARAAGVKAGDVVYKIDGEEVYRLDTEQVSKRLRGEAGTEVELTVVRDNDELTFKMVREEINNVSMYVDYEGELAIVHVVRFDVDTGTLVQKAAKEEFAKKSVKKVILDLRGNGGGYVSAAKDLLSLWVDGELILTQRGKRLGEEQTYANRGLALLKDVPTVVLVNGTSASASEIVAGALKDYGKATVLGETTFGKGVVQTLVELSRGALLKVTTAQWYTPNGTSISGDGITPDKEVELTYDDANHGRDPQMDAAKKILKEEK